MEMILIEVAYEMILNLIKVCKRVRLTMVFTRAEKLYGRPSQLKKGFENWVILISVNHQLVENWVELEVSNYEKQKYLKTRNLKVEDVKTITPRRFDVKTIIRYRPLVMFNDNAEKIRHNLCLVLKNTIVRSFVLGYTVYQVI